MQGRAAATGTPVTSDNELLCGDCRQPLEHGGPGRRGGDSAPGQRYCPTCATSEREVLHCPHCGSEVCTACGSILESAEDLGYG
ncbi:MAG: hypothetical protein OXH99_21920 [Bryobacterales bacterium]|nr:hypothetical protein [Bryobacterales bacterium]